LKRNHLATLPQTLKVFFTQTMSFVSRDAARHTVRISFNQGPIFRTFFSVENHFPRKTTFRGKFRGISWKNDFLKLFPRRIPFFPKFFGGKFSAKFPPKFSPEKMYEKLAPGRAELRNMEREEN
jgi:hypothetical protein